MDLLFWARNRPGMNYKHSSGGPSVDVTIMENHMVDICPDLRVEDNYPMNKLGIKGKQSIDMYLPHEKIAIEYDPDRWHGLQKDAERDQRKNDLLREKGIETVRVRHKDALDLTGDTDFTFSNKEEKEKAMQDAMDYVVSKHEEYHKNESRKYLILGKIYHHAMINRMHKPKVNLKQNSKVVKESKQTRKITPTQAFVGGVVTGLAVPMLFNKKPSGYSNPTAGSLPGAIQAESPYHITSGDKMDKFILPDGKIVDYTYLEKHIHEFYTEDMYNYELTEQILANHSTAKDVMSFYEGYWEACYKAALDELLLDDYNLETLGIKVLQDE